MSELIHPAVPPHTLTHQSPAQPEQSQDAVLGGYAGLPAQSVVLGGIFGVKRSLASPRIPERVAALTQAMQYGEAGLELAIAALQDNAEQVQRAAYALLRRRTEPRVTAKLQQYSPLPFFELRQKMNVASSAIDLSRDGRTLVVAGSVLGSLLQVWDLTTNRMLRQIEGHRDPIRAIALSADGKTLISSSFDGTVLVWDVPTGQRVRTLLESTDQINALVINSEAGTVFGTNALNNTVKIWDLHRGEEATLAIGQAGIVSTLAVSPSGQLLATAGEDGSLKVWWLRPNNTSLLLHQFTGYRYAVTSSCFSHDERTIATGNSDRTVRLWNLETGKLLHTLTGHASPVSAVQISADGHTIVSTGYDGTLRIWDQPTGRLLRVLEGHQEHIHSLAMGDRLLVTADHRSIRIWGLP